MSANVVLSLELALLKEKQNINIDAVDDVLNRELTEQIQGKVVYYFISQLITVMCRVVSCTVTSLCPRISKDIACHPVTSHT